MSIRGLSTLFSTLVLLIWAIVTVAGLFIGGAWAISIDDFTDNQYVQSTNASNINISTAASLNCIGGKRKFVTTFLSGGTTGKVSLASSLGELGHSQDVGVRGRSVVIWDGDVVLPTAKSDGLPAIDFFQDLGTKFIISHIEGDLGGGNLSIKVYDAIDPFGLTFSVATKPILTTPINGYEFIYESIQSDFTLHGPLGAADFSRVGAIELLVDGSDVSALDVIMGNIKTDGYCEIFPDAQGRVVDECGVCAGDNSSCAGCDGIPNSNTVIDECGVCGGDNLSCIECVEINIFETQAELDGLAKEQEFVVRAAMNLLNKAGKQKGLSFKKYITKNKTRARELQVDNWVLSWTLPTVINECSENPICVTTSNLPVLTTYREQALELRKIAIKATKKIKKVSGTTYSDLVGNLRRAAKETYSDAINLSETVPELNYACG